MSQPHGLDSSYLPAVASVDTESACESFVRILSRGAVESAVLNPAQFREITFVPLRTEPSRHAYLGLLQSAESLISMVCNHCEVVPFPHGSCIFCIYYVLPVCAGSAFIHRNADEEQGDYQ